MILLRVARLALWAVLTTLVITSICATTQAATYTYDTLNRLTGVAYPDGTTIAYTYDSAGNRLSQVISNPSTPLPKVSVDKSTLTFSAAAGQAASGQTIAVGNVGGGSLQWVASPTASWLSVTPGSGTNSGTVNVTASAAGMPAGTYNANVTILASASNAPLSIPVILTVTGAQGNPLVSSGGIVSATGSSPAIARGSIASIYGSALADLPATATTVPLPLALVNVQVSVNGLKAPLWYVGPGQINFQVPFEAPLQGQASVIVSRDGVASAPSNVTLTPYAPSIFMYQRTANALDPIIVHAANNQLVTPANPAVSGEYLTVYGTGIGDLNVLPVTGALSPENPVATATLTPTATIGGAKATVTFAGLTPDTVGLAQFNILVPGSLPVGNPLPLVINFGGAATPPVKLAVQSDSLNANPAYTIETMAGSGPDDSLTGAYSAGDGGPATSANLTKTDFAVDTSGNLYIFDQARIRRVDASTNLITTIAGTGTAGYAGDNGPAITALLGANGKLAVDTSGNIFIADTNNNRIRKISASTGVITTIAGTGASASFDSGDGDLAVRANVATPGALVLDPAGNLYLVDEFDRIRKISAATGVISTVAGSYGTGYSGDGGPATQAHFFDPRGLALDVYGDIYIADAENMVIRMIDASTGIITTVAGSGPAIQAAFGGDGGPATSAVFFDPESVAVDGAGNLYIADTANFRVRKVNGATGVITTIAGTGAHGFSGDGGPGTGAKVTTANDVAVDTAGHVYFSDAYNYRIRVLTPTQGQ